MLGISPVDPFEQIAELAHRQRHGPALGRRPDETPSLQPLGVERQADAVVPDDLHQATATPPEDVEISAMRIALEVLLNGAVRITKRSRKIPTLLIFRPRPPPTRHSLQRESNEVWVC